MKFLLLIVFSTSVINAMFPPPFLMQEKVTRRLGKNFTRYIVEINNIKLEASHLGNLRNYEIVAYRIYNDNSYKMPPDEALSWFKSLEEAYKKQLNTKD